MVEMVEAGFYDHLVHGLTRIFPHSPTHMELYSIHPQTPPKHLRISNILPTSASLHSFSLSTLEFNPPFFVNHDVVLIYCTLTMSFLAIYLLYAVASGSTISSAVGEDRQYPLVLENQRDTREPTGDSIVRLCPESSDIDVLAIERIVNSPQVPFLCVSK